ncbi:MAG: SUMF1/EgtB/PvdO family nonheme iron enzyme [Planctomycetota bacterium]
MQHATKKRALPLLFAALLLTACGESKPAPQTGSLDPPPATAVLQPTTDTASEDTHSNTVESETPDTSRVEPTPDTTAEAPPRFTDHAPQYWQERNADGEIDIIEAEPVPFDMILIPVDEAQDIAPFYMGETEVTWEMVESWGYCRDIADWEEAMRLVGEGLRPSWLDGWAQVTYRMDQLNSPVVGATRHTAEMFCLWLSEKTGRTYRLPTPYEWAHALDLGGGCPDDAEALLAVGSFQENSGEFAEPDPFDPFADELDHYPAISPVKCHAPNALGIYDLLGNAGEWVAAQGGEAYLMGGHYAVSVAEMSAEWTDVEDHDIWNEIYPQRPVSKFWYWGEHHFQGFRLVCEAEPAPQEAQPE